MTRAPFPMDSFIITVAFTSNVAVNYVDIAPHSPPPLLGYSAILLLLLPGVSGEIVRAGGGLRAGLGSVRQELSQGVPSFCAFGLGLTVAAPEKWLHCLNNCGFFGSAATMNFCSKCYREINAKQPSFSSHLKPQQPALEQLNAKHPSIPLSAPPLPLSGDVPMVEAVAAVETAIDSGPSSSAEQEVEEQEQDEEEQPRKSKKRCYACNRRVGLTGFKCRCGDLFCAQHRYSDMHDCPFDYKTAGRLAILKANPVVKAPKIDKMLLKGFFLMAA